MEYYHDMWSQGIFSGAVALRPYILSYPLTLREVTGTVGTQDDRSIAMPVGDNLQCTGLVVCAFILLSVTRIVDNAVALLKDSNPKASYESRLGPIHRTPIAIRTSVTMDVVTYFGGWEYNLRPNRND